MNTCDSIGPLLDGYHDRELERFERLRIERHLESCDACRRDLASLGAVGHAVRATVAGVPTPDLWQAIAAQLPDDAARRRPPLRARLPLRRRWLSAAAAAAVAAFAFLVSYARDPFPAPAADTGPSGVVRSVYAPERPVIVFEAEQSGDPTIIWVMDEDAAEAAPDVRL